MHRNLLILGGSGKSGIKIVQQAIERGHIVTAYARNATKLKEEYGSAISEGLLTIIECEISSLRERLSPSFSKVDAIISVLGPNSLSYTGTEIAQLYEWILAELRHLPVAQRPYLLVTSTQSIVDPDDGVDFFTKIHIFFIMMIAPGARRETMAIKDVFMREVKSHDTEVDWTVCRLNLLRDSGLPIEGGKAGYVGKKGWISTMDRAQLACWLIREAEKEPAERKWVRKMPALWGDDVV
ncbi:hypothetical protein H2202_010634 [Exophiala xenobiotica]|nr:hypothetical protein H2202_010634 [Exophiala xenobiotica]KAK5216071.1 hypothetical protein LTR72_010947 [Exophiala xenobiotica]KAK5278126.1 hypothetical protein LTR40_009547 [Exophiala xenobiotica]KAK5285476.1 hypothetical protein LTR14_010872 [Exophiala xenobiotica]KAK5367080.1 hypothetical protein LTS13_007933 [Exophiala xenobiotica]